MIVGLDPGNDRFGVAVLDAYPTDRPSAPPPLLYLGAVGMDGSARALDSGARVSGRVQTQLSAGRAVTPTDVVVRIEVPPPTAGAHVNHGGQAALGWALGWVSGIVCARLDERGHRVETVEVTPWRDAMLVWSTRWGKLATAPTYPPVAAYDPRTNGRTQASNIERMTDGSTMLVWAGCNHKLPFKLSDAKTFPYRRCPTCAELPFRASKQDVSDWKRDAWKALACALVKHHWLEPYMALVDDARSRARTARADHELVGVPDACEAVWIGCSAMEAL